MENTKDTSILYANDLSVAYGDKVIIPSMQVFIPKEKSLRSSDQMDVENPHC